MQQQQQQSDPSLDHINNVSKCQNSKASLLQSAPVSLAEISFHDLERGVLLGKGSFGTVFRAIWHHPNEVLTNNSPVLQSN